ncbi:histidine phosphatase family protein [Mogibacterium timidum]|uniref:Histidine phosphatase family protein n=1 Tax=Mogibacterium timidum TaxID=35519 RepID=A0A7Y8VSB8_9FIRM|nr:histidine phosphatase family protein [Mogibacterium timidum]NWO23679.1 histidine phosphatase family protein [Mogibacterium timidum]
MRLYVLRHGQTQLNSERRLQGHMQTELNDVGIAQAEMVASILNDNGIKFDRIYSSPLERAIRTGEIATGVSRERFVIDHNLTEIDFGINEGRKYDELQGASGNIFLSPETYLPPEGGESLESLLNRMKHFLERMRDEECEGNVLAVSHGTAIHMILLYLRGMSLSELWTEHVGNCNVTVIDIDDREMKIRDDLQIATDSCIK